jgi:cytochrome b pre-mRNA-processing protein 3
MILRRFLRTHQDDNIASLYGAIVAQARLPAFYRDYSVPDTVNGRFEMIVLHAALLLRRLDGGDAPARGLGQAVFDRFCADMDGNLREMGVGDLAVPRKMKSIGEAFYGRRRAYDAALAAAEAAPLAAALARNVYESDAGAGVGRLAAYTRTAAAGLAAQGIATFQQGQIGFPDPAGIVDPHFGTDVP